MRFVIVGNKPILNLIFYEMILRKLLSFQHFTSPCRDVTEIFRKIGQSRTTGSRILDFPFKRRLLFPAGSWALNSTTPCSSGRFTMNFS